MTHTVAGEITKADCAVPFYKFMSPQSIVPEKNLVCFVGLNPSSPASTTFYP